MTVHLDRVEPSLSRYLISYVDAPKHFVPVRRPASFRRRSVAVASIGALALVVAGAVGIGVNRPSAEATPAARAGYEAAPGEFRLGPGNAQPPGVVVPAGNAPTSVSDAAPGEFRLGPGLAQPPGVVVPAGNASTSVSDAAPGEFRLGPGNAQPPGVVVPGD
jgi:hypothetical protein